MRVSRRWIATLAATLLLGALAVAGPPRAEAAPAYDLSTQMDLASNWAASRGQVGISVLDRETGFVSENAWSHTQMRSASIVKLFVAESLLSRARSGQIVLSANDRALIDVMIRSSDDAAMSSLYSRFGGQAMIAEVARKYDLSELGPPPTPSYWGMYRITAHDITSFYQGVLNGGLAPADRDHLVGLMRSATRNGTDGFDQYFGIPQAMPAEVRGVKQGWMCCQEGQRRLHTTGLVGPDGGRFVVSVLLQVGSGTSYAEAGRTLTGVIERLFPGGRVPPPLSSRNPLGHLDRVAQVSPGVFRLSGWALDQDAATAATRVDTYVNGAGWSSGSANQPRPDVAAAYPGAGAAHGWSVDVVVPDGVHKVCSFFINVGPGTGNTVRCVTVQATLNPVGQLDSARVTGVRTIEVRGWTADPDSPRATLEAHTYLNGRGTALTASASRPDVARALPQYGPVHGFTGRATSGSGGLATACTFGINAVGSPGSHTLLRCIPVTLPLDVIGSLDTASGGGGRVSVSGWSVDSDAGTEVTRVDLYADGVGLGSTRADLDRPDLVRHYSDTGAAHGFRADFALSPGAHVICAYGIPASPRSTAQLLGCRAVVV